MSRSAACELWLQILLTVLGCCTAWWLAGWKASAVLLLTAAAMLLTGAVFRRRNNRTLVRLSDEIGQVLHGADQITFSDYDEGELSILCTEIRKLTVMLREQNTRLQNEKNYLKESLEDISHQLRTPLTSMMLILGMMRKQPPDSPQYTENLRELTALLTRMQWLIETLLTLSRVEAGAVRFREELISCRTLIADALEPISIALELKNISVQVQITGDPQMIGDRLYCTEALGNLLKNCMEHTPQGGSIRICSEQTALYASVTVTDTGTGISQESLPHLFERFYRGSEFSKSGYGIGLAFAKRVISAQGGSLQARNAVPSGAEFEIRFFRLPKEESEEPETA